MQDNEDHLQVTQNPMLAVNWKNGFCIKNNHIFSHFNIQKLQKFNGNIDNV